MLPREYNDKYGMTRCFRSIYMDAAEFIQYKNARQLLTKYPYDGLIIYVVCLKDDLQERVVKLQSLYSDPQIVVCLSRLPFSHNLLLKQYEAAGGNF